MESRILRLIVTDVNVKQISRIKRIGCGACSSIKIIDCNTLLEENVYQCKLNINNSLETKPVSGDQESIFKLLDNDASILGNVQIKVSTVFSKEIYPNKIVMTEVTPEEQISITFKKNSPFVIENIETGSSDVNIVNWNDNEEYFKLNLFIYHTFENRQVNGNLIICTTGEEIFIPLTVDIQEYIEIYPRNVFLGVLKAGDKVKRTFRIFSKKKFNILKYSTPLKNSEVSFVKESDNEVVFQISLNVKESLKNGPLESFLVIYTDLTEFPMKIPIYGYCTSKTAKVQEDVNPK